MFTQAHKNALISQLRAALAHVEGLPVSRSCRDCLYADMGGMGPLRCRIASHAAPPPEVVEAGCEKYVFNPADVPF